MEGKDPELQASRQAGLLDFIASALPASHTSKPEACQVMLHLLKLLRVVLSTPANRSYFLAQNLLPPIIPMLSAALENYIKIAASLGVPGNFSLPSSKASVENFESISEILNSFLWTVTAIFGHISSEERQLQMRDGLLELLISYQVIHRLRDLFALHDRPQMEGSAFPGPILLSIQLLVVLTSRSGRLSYIDWESSPVIMEQEIGSEGAKLADSAHFVVSNSWGDYTPLSMINGSSVVHLPDVPEDRPLDEMIKVNKNNESISIGKDSELEHDSSVKLKVDDIEKIDLDESKSGDMTNLSIPQKDEKHTVVNVAVQKNEKVSNLGQPVVFLLSAISETGLVSLPSLLTAVLLQANNRSSSEQVGFLQLANSFTEVVLIYFEDLYCEKSVDTDIGLLNKMFFSGIITQVYVHNAINNCHLSPKPYMFSLFFWRILPFAICHMSNYFLLLKGLLVIVCRVYTSIPIYNEKDLQ